MSAIHRLVVVGGVAAGMSAASQAKRRQPDLEVVVFEQGRWVSYGACGMPYNIQDPRRAIDDLVVITPERFRTQRHIDVRINHRVEEIDLAGSRVRVQGPHGDSWEGFDGLVLATGCRPRLPRVDGVRLPGVFVLHTLDDAARIKEYLQRDDLRRAVIVGGGHIGLEMADVFCARGLAVTVLKRSPSLPPGYPDDIGTLLRAELDKHGVELLSGITLLGIEGDDRVRQVHTDQGRLPADLVLLATGVQPNVELARAAGIQLGDSGAIAVSAGMATSATRVWAAGDCAEA
ncbi:MAG: NADH oxidase, partial [Deltaproteobacteria bacterium]